MNVTTDARRAGFTLIEILLAMTIFVAGVAGIYALLSTGLAMQREGLDLARSNRQLEGIVHALRRQISAGQHYDAEARAWTDVPAAVMPDGTHYSVEFVAWEDDPEGALVALIRVARTESGLARARPVSHALFPGPSLSDAVARYRAQQSDSGRP